MPLICPRFQVWRGCERSVITYSSLISACEKAGELQLALDLFGEMHAEGVQPNTVTYNSLITACAQGELSRTMHSCWCRCCLLLTNMSGWQRSRVCWRWVSQLKFRR